MNDNLIWKEENRKTVFTCPIFSVSERICRSPGPPSGRPGGGGESAPRGYGAAGQVPRDYLNTFTVLDCSEWAIIMPLLETGRGEEFVMVRQWRHGARELSLEFPGGVLEKGESPEAGAARELREETGYGAGKIEKLGVFNPNPAIMSNSVHIFLATELIPGGAQDLDRDEYVEVENIPWRDVLYGLGKAPFIHALMGTAMALYLRRKSPIDAGETAGV